MSAPLQAGEVFAFVARVAAARKEATAEQLRELETKLVPQLVAMRINHSIEGPKTVLAEIMGYDWRPAGELDVTPQEGLTLIEQGMRERGHDPDTLLGPPK